MSSPKSTAASRLCKACGLCCNGVLFQIVRLQTTDSAKHLEALGMNISRKKHEPYFKQPCSFLHDRTCTHYSARPWRCRLFECRQLQRLADHVVTEDEVMHRIDEVKRRVAAVETMLRQAGNTAEHLPLSERYAQVMAAAGDAETATVHRHLVTEMGDLNDVLNEGFRL